MAKLKKEPFKFEYTVPSLDWYDIIKGEIKPDDYVYFKLSLRYGNTWWLVGMNPPSDHAKGYRWTEKDIGRISDRDIVRFVEWAKQEDGFGGSKLTEVSAISGSLDILREVEKLLGGRMK